MNIIYIKYVKRYSTNLTDSQWRLLDSFVNDTLGLLLAVVVPQMRLPWQ
jgi:hypothetical protein